jgi:hypothetical protein
MTPYRKYGEQISSSGIATVEVPRFTNKLFAKFVLPKMADPFIHTQLDEIGSRVWLSIDGKQNISEIINKLSAEMGQSIAPAFERITMFMTQLYRSGFISFNELSERSNNG